MARASLAAGTRAGTRRSARDKWLGQERVELVAVGKLAID
jgi:hypothetical protein